jgi:hypothetical protein
MFFHLQAPESFEPYWREKKNNQEIDITHLEAAKQGLKDSQWKAGRSHRKKVLLPYIFRHCHCPQQTSHSLLGKLGQPDTFPS